MDQRVRVLVIDDDEADFQIVRNLLESSDRATFVVDHADSQADAFTALERSEYGVVVIDYHLGAENGIDVGKEIHRRGIQVPLVLLTGFGDQQVHDLALESGFQDYLLKNRLRQEVLVRSLLWCCKTPDGAEDILSGRLTTLQQDVRTLLDETRAGRLEQAAATETLRHSVKALAVEESQSGQSWWMRAWSAIIQNPVASLVALIAITMLVLLVIVSSQLLDPDLLRALKDLRK